MKAIWSSAFVAASLAVATGGSLADDVTYRKDIKPLFDAKCAACHGAGSPALVDFLMDEKKYKESMKGPRMNTYADMLVLVGWPDSGAIMRRLDDGKNPLAGGKPGNMYQYLGADDAERQKNLQTFKAWVGEGGWNLNRFKARGKVPGVTKEQLEKIRAKY